VVEILEQGAVSFLGVVAPKHAASPERVDGVYVVLAPDGRVPLRRLEVRRRRLPGAGRGAGLLAQVDRIATAAARLTEDVRRRGGPSARVLAVGRYALARHGDHLHLAYALARACRRGRLAVAAGVAQAASWILGATPALDALGAELALAAGGPDDRVGDALIAALLRRGPRPRVASFARAAELRRTAAPAERSSPRRPPDGGAHRHRV
jgi:hypothetical protein